MTIRGSCFNFCHQNMYKHTYLYVQCVLFVSDFNQIRTFWTDFSNPPPPPTPVYSFTKIRSAGTALLYAAGRVDGRMHRLKTRRKAFPLQAWSGSWGSRRLRLWIVSTFGNMKVVRSSPLRIGRLHPQECSWYSFLEADSTPGHMVLSVASEKKIPSDTAGDRSRDLPASSAVRKPEEHLQTYKRAYNVWKAFARPNCKKGDRPVWDKWQHVKWRPNSVTRRYVKKFRRRFVLLCLAVRDARKTVFLTLIQSATPKLPYTRDEEFT